ncbi:MAG: YcaO-like family protein, partial [Candidatus Saccharibacteria bacterium]|nr:YcaO-like family protein [Candidatus Saccharibacteria bacterium]
AVAESLERFSASTVFLQEYMLKDLQNKLVLPFSDWPLFTKEQQEDSNFPFSSIYLKETKFVEVTSFNDNSTVYVPQALVVLRDDFETGLPTSSGLAAATNSKVALLSSILELIERDALMTTWLNAVVGRRIKQPSHHEAEVQSLSGICRVYDITPAYSPYPVIAVMGGIPKEGKMRYSLGVACKTTYKEAIEKAYTEWHQGVFFAGVFAKNVNTDRIKTIQDVNTFDDHAVYYSLFPEQWSNLPMLFDDKIHPKRLEISDSQPDALSALKNLKKSLNRSNIRLYYVDLSGIDAIQSGVRVVRSVSPDLAMIFAHQSWPLIDRVGGFKKSRYPKDKQLVDFPFLMPHPLG